VSDSLLDSLYDYRILYFDDDTKLLDAISKALASQKRVQVFPAATLARATEILRDTYIDAAYVDLEPDLPGGGYEFMKKVARDYGSVTIVPMSKHTDPVHLRGIFSLIGSGVPPFFQAELDRPADFGRVVAFMEKERFPRSWETAAVHDELVAWDRLQFQVDGLAEVAALLDARRNRVPGLRRALDEVKVEVARLLQKLFAPLSRGFGTGSATLRLRPVERQGLSAAVAISCELETGATSQGLPALGVQLILKIGPTSDIELESRRFDEFVRFGVNLRQRVEVLGTAFTHSLGCIAYSFAGGLHGDELVSLDRLMRDVELHALAASAIQEVFDASQKNWYGVDAERISPGMFVREHYSIDWPGRYEVINQRGRKLARKSSLIGFDAATSHEDGALYVDNEKLVLPQRKIFGSGAIQSPVRTCMLHGDLHGGNVLVETTDAEDGARIGRVCFIDFRHAVVGPVATDCVVLQLSLRLAEADALLASSGLDEAMKNASRRQQRDRERLGAWLGKSACAPVSSWEMLDDAILRGLEENFDPVSSVEYLTVAIPLALRMLSYDLGDVARVRVSAFVSALYAIWQRMQTTE
jgi:hypothetical protein